MFGIDPTTGRERDPAGLSRAWIDQHWNELSQAQRGRLMAVLAGGLVTGAVAGFKGLFAVAGLFIVMVPQHERDRLDPLVVGTGLGSGVVGSSVGLSGLAMISVLASYLSTQKPSVESFAPFFEQWFRTEFYPQIQRKLQTELDDRRRRSASFYSHVADTLNSLFLEWTKKMHESMTWEMVKARVLPAAVFKDNVFFRTCVVDLGTPQSPCPFTFWGMNGRWHLAPYLKLDFEGVSILGMLESHSNTSHHTSS